jgi:hypothetical protein
MMTVARSWVRENATLVYFLIAQAFALVSLGAYGLSYMVKLETRVNTMETRGSPHLEKIDTRLTVLEGQTLSNKQSIDRISEIMLRELPVKDRK